MAGEYTYDNINDFNLDKKLKSDKDFPREVLKMVSEGHPMSVIAKKYGLHAPTLRLYFREDPERSRLLNEAQADGRRHNDELVDEKVRQLAIGKNADTKASIQAINLYYKRHGKYTQKHEHKVDDSLGAILEASYAKGTLEKDKGV